MYLQFNIASITPCKANKAYTMLYAAPGSETNREVLK